MFLALELAQKHTLFDYVVETGPFPEPLAAFCFKQMVEGISAVHSVDLCHRDIKCENILVDQFYRMKIADFSWASQPDNLSV